MRAPDESGHSLDRPAYSPCVEGGGGADGPELCSFDELRPVEHCTTENVLVPYSSVVMRQNCCKTDRVEFWKILLYFYSRNYISYIHRKHGLN